MTTWKNTDGHVTFILHTIKAIKKEDCATLDNEVVP